MKCDFLWRKDKFITVLCGKNQLWKVEKSENWYCSLPHRFEFDQVIDKLAYSILKTSIFVVGILLVYVWVSDKFPYSDPLRWLFMRLVYPRLKMARTGRHSKWFKSGTRVTRDITYATHGIQLKRKYFCMLQTNEDLYIYGALIN